MSIEDWALRFQGLTDEQIARIHRALEESVHTIANIKTIIQIAEHELPRLKRTVSAFESALASINAAQRRFDNV